MSRRPKSPPTRNPNTPPGTRYAVRPLIGGQLVLDVAAMPRPHAQAMLDVLHQLEVEPRPRRRSLKILRAPLEGLYRIKLKIGGKRYRVVYAIDDTGRAVTIVAAGARENFYGIAAERWRATT